MTSFLCKPGCCAKLQQLLGEPEEPLPLPDVSRLGVGTIWAGRQWPPGNARYKPPAAGALDRQIRTALAQIAPGQRLMLDTASGYGDSEVRLGEWLRAPANAEAAARCVVATKFGESFDGASGRTAVALDAAAAERQLSASEAALGGEGGAGRVALLYSHVTSQLSPEAAAAVYADAALADFLREAKAGGRVALLGTSCSYPAVLRAALEQGQLADLDVVQLAAKACVAEPELVEALAAAGKLVVANSPVRQLLSRPDEEATQDAVDEAVDRLLESCPRVAVVLVGTGSAVRLAHIGQCILKFRP